VVDLSSGLPSGNAPSNSRVWRGLPITIGARVLRAQAEPTEGMEPPGRHASRQAAADATAPAAQDRRAVDLARRRAPQSPER
jgi:hypothetical protein